VSPIDPTAEIAADAFVHPTATVWGLAQVREGTRIGAQSIVGRGAYVGTAVDIGARVKIQNLAMIYEPATVGDGAFIGPAAILTNDTYPRAITPSGEPVRASDWTSVGVAVREGASIGAGAVCVAPVTIGRWAMVAAGAIVIHDVPDFALVAGTPARQIGWVGRAGRRLVDDGNGRWHCAVTGERFHESAGLMQEEDDV
jgi:UDP-2-acetamido-3-amino-2,3-dideoxy-glucuronate N-acetyltransferase